MGKTLAPNASAADLLKTIPGVSDVIARVIVAEIGADMSRFPTAGHLVSWAGLCPRSDESAGKRRSTHIRKSSTWLKTTLVTAAWSAVRKKDSYLRSQFLRIKSRRGAKKAIVAVAASMLTAVYHMLDKGVAYHDLGPHHFDRLDKTRAINRLVRRLNELGCNVQVQRAAQELLDRKDVIEPRMCSAHMEMSGSSHLEMSGFGPERWHGHSSREMFLPPRPENQVASL